ncbi:flagellar biosynthesis repressor FlbT [Paracoccus ravus]|uniref:flagellar biosynthesis repressor FlbT n=1 Tax=Paracoccus ravus TaxID=2447760 RepID=UPI00106E54DB|nr:flagellar biosynthesis repressor FlbT [Paracoccus ravus]
MTGLILKLSPNERVLINGAVIENCDRRTRITIRSPNAAVLRLRDAIHPDQANTPVSRVCYICQLVLTGDAEEAEGKKQALFGIEQLSRAFRDTESRAILDQSTAALVAGNHYLAMKLMRRLIPREARLLAQVPT